MYDGIKIVRIEIPIEMQSKIKTTDSKEKRQAMLECQWRTKGHEMIYFNALSWPAGAYRPRWRSREDHLRGTTRRMKQEEVQLLRGIIEDSFAAFLIEFWICQIFRN